MRRRRIPALALAFSLAAFAPAATAQEDPLQAAENLIDDLARMIDERPGTAFADKLEDVADKTQAAIDELAKSPPDAQAAVGNL